MTDTHNPPIRTLSRPKIKRPSPYLTIRVDFISRSAALPGKTLHVAMAIWRAATLLNTSTITLSGPALVGFGVAKDAVYPALDRLVDAKLIVTDRRRGRPPKITLLDVTGNVLPNSILQGGTLGVTSLY
jgi:hypothetical protein